MKARAGPYGLYDNTEYIEYTNVVFAYVNTMYNRNNDKFIRIIMSSSLLSFSVVFFLQSLTFSNFLSVFWSLFKNNARKWFSERHSWRLAITLTTERVLNLRAPEWRWKADLHAPISLADFSCRRIWGVNQRKNWVKTCGSFAQTLHYWGDVLPIKHSQKWNKNR